MHETIGEYIRRGGTITVIPARGKHDKQATEKTAPPKIHRIAKASTLCQGCKSRSTCIELCQRAEQYTGQDCRPEREIPFSLVKGCDPSMVDAEQVASRFPTIPSFGENKGGTKRLVLWAYLKYFLPVTELAEIAYISPRYARQIIAPYRSKSARKQAKNGLR